MAPQTLNFSAGLKEKQEGAMVKGWNAPYPYRLNLLKLATFVDYVYKCE